MSLHDLFKRAHTCRCTVLFLALAAASLLAPANLPAYDNGVVPVNTPQSARRMITDLIETHGKAYPGGPGFLQRLDAFEKNPPADPAERQRQLDALIREAALANPILDFDKILLVRRKPHGTDTGLMMNFHCNDAIKRNGWDNEIGILSNLRTTPTFTPVHRQSKGAIMRDLDLHFDAKRFLFASINAKG
ncbi:MAG: hypothetical protein LBD01_07230, partial [Puniceicoccales bacterium]|nr:hypothetical protein [Puniceicoccales bacterium]